MPNPKNKNWNTYLKYSGLGFQMIGALVLGAYGGHWIDSQMNNARPIATMICMFICLAAAFVQFIRSVKQEK